MRGIGVKVSVLSLVAVSFIVGVLFFSGCTDDPKEVCCKCTCYVNDNALPERTEYVSGNDLNCTQACQTRCQDELGMEMRDPTKVDCGSTPTD